MFFQKVYSSSPVVSFEFFPPKEREKLPDTLGFIRETKALNPHFMTVTYGAGGGTREFTLQMVSFIAKELNVPAVAHLTCVQHSLGQIDRLLDELQANGITNILALRGDGLPSANGESDAFSCARDLVKYITKKGGFSVAVAGYPETHREAVSAEADLAYLMEKVDSGAEVVLTQLFFDNTHYFRFVERAHKVGISVPIVPGIMPISNVAQVKRFTALCGAELPAALTSALAEISEDQEAVVNFGIEYAAKQCDELLAAGAPGLHLYTLNRSFQVRRLLERVGLAASND